MPKRFYIKLYVFWAFWVTSRSLFYALLLSLFSVLLVYISKGLAPLNKETFLALKEIVYLSFPVAFSLSFIIALLLVFKKLFSQTIDGHKFVLYNCSHEEIFSPLLSDVTDIWRKWLFLTVWAILFFLVLLLGGAKLLLGILPPLHWFNGLSLYLLVITLGGLVFTFGVKRCKKIGIIDA